MRRSKIPIAIAVAVSAVVVLGATRATPPVLYDVVSRRNNGRFRRVRVQ